MAIRKTGRPGWLVLSLLFFFLSLSSALAGTIKYTYDEAGRLTKADYGGKIITYTYDAAGNLLERKVEAGGPLAVGATSLPEGEVNVAYSDDLQISGGSTPYTVAVTKGSLPEGLNVNNNGIISGTPTKAETNSLTLKVTDQDGSSVIKKYKLKVFKALNITTKSLRKGKAGKKYSATLKAAGGKKSFTWSLLDGTLPDGLALDAATGKFTGTPTAAGSSELTFQVTDPLNGEAEKTLTLTIE